MIIHAMQVHIHLASVYVMCNRDEKHLERKTRSGELCMSSKSHKSSQSSRATTHYDS